MTPQEQEIVDLLNANSGKMTYRALYDSVSPENRIPLRKNLKRLKYAGSLKESNVLDEATGQVIHNVETVV